MTTTPQAALLSAAETDQHLDAILKAAGSALRHYTMQKSRDDMRAALRAALSATQPAQAAQSDGRGTDAQIEKERDIARHAIVGSLAAGYAGQVHPGADHWLSAAHEAGARIKELEAQAAQSEPVKPLFASKVAARKWAELQAQGHRMQHIAFDGGHMGCGTIDPWGVVLWGDLAAQGAGEVVGWAIIKDGKVVPGLIDRPRVAEMLRGAGETLRPLTYADTAQPAPVVPERWVVARETSLDVGFGDDVRKGGRPELGYSLINNAATFSTEDEAVSAIQKADLPIGWVVLPLSRLLPDLLAATPTPPAQAAQQGEEA